MHSTVQILLPGGTNHWLLARAHHLVGGPDAFYSKNGSSWSGERDRIPNRDSSAQRSAGVLGECAGICGGKKEGRSVVGLLSLMSVSGRRHHLGRRPSLVPLIYRSCASPDCRATLHQSMKMNCLDLQVMRLTWFPRDSAPVNVGNVGRGHRSALETRYRDV
jgi:hypothetical protein